jgi:hypothetical protein
MVYNATPRAELYPTTEHNPMPITFKLAHYHIDIMRRISPTIHDVEIPQRLGYKFQVPRFKPVILKDGNPRVVIAAVIIPTLDRHTIRRR